ncbi:DeoR/GlpR family DNA-binding transcription regulator [Jiangella alba]|uniref:Lactose phosphotransferase system repressor n=1 Tax=Jiangella alba TaxID=561176 RepID=A0A1H5MN43_9ACTN|nr:DeoR/GlpR family DNA-binding transcription regulator [Jiangella alba]SEE90623.1 transcriptional regulator, DeoR family [Jiangella alba]
MRDRNGSLFASERQEEIYARARRDGRVDSAGLAAELGVSHETIRRDLKYLEDIELLRRVHGGAILVDRLQFVPDLAERSLSMAEEKRAIGAAALSVIPDEGTVILDSGTTTARLAEALPADIRLTVLTNSLPITQTLLDRPHIEILNLGGRVNRRTRSTSESWALHALSEVSVDVAVLGASGLSVRRGLTTSDQHESAVKRAMIKAARRVVVLADHSKFGADLLSIVAPLPELDLLITDDGGDPAARQELAAAGLAVEVIGTDRSRPA